MTYRPRLDSEISGTGTYNGGFTRTEFTYPITAYGIASTSELKAYRLDTGEEISSSVQYIDGATSTVGINGNLTGIEVAIGKYVDASLSLPPPFYRDQNGTVLFNRTTRVNETIITYEDSGSFTVTWTPEDGQSNRVETITVTASTVSDGLTKHNTAGLNTTLNVTVDSVDGRPINIVGYTQELRGDAR